MPCWLCPKALVVMSDRECRAHLARPTPIDHIDFRAAAGMMALLNWGMYMDIDFFKPADAEELAPLLEEMQAFYSVFCPPRDVIIETLRRLPVGAEILLARIDGRIAGFAGIGANYAGPGLKPGFFLKDLYVLRAWRGRNIGKSLMARIAAIAVERGYTRIDWTASNSDEKLLRFYEGLGGTIKNDRVFFRLEGEDLNALAEMQTGGAR